MKVDWLQAFLSDAVRKKLCTRSNCTTCGAMDFRRGVLAGLDSPKSDPWRLRFERESTLEIAEALSGITPDGIAYASLEAAVRCLICDLWSGIPVIDQEIEKRLAGSWAGEVLDRMKEHHQARLAARELQSPANAKKRHDEKKRLKQEQHLGRLALKQERDKLWRAHKGKNN